MSRTSSAGTSSRRPRLPVTTNHPLRKANRISRQGIGSPDPSGAVGAASPAADPTRHPPSVTVCPARIRSTSGPTCRAAISCWMRRSIRASTRRVGTNVGRTHTPSRREQVTVWCRALPAGVTASSSVVSSQRKTTGRPPSSWGVTQTRPWVNRLRLPAAGSVALARRFTYTPPAISATPIPSATTRLAVALSSSDAARKPGPPTTTATAHRARNSFIDREVRRARAMMRTPATMPRTPRTGTTVSATPAALTPSRATPAATSSPASTLGPQPRASSRRWSSSSPSWASRAAASMAASEPRAASVVSSAPRPASASEGLVFEWAHTPDV